MSFFFEFSVFLSAETFMKWLISYSHRSSCSVYLRFNQCLCISFMIFFLPKSKLSLFARKRMQVSLKNIPLLSSLSRDWKCCVWVWDENEVLSFSGWLALKWVFLTLDRFELRGKFGFTKNTMTMNYQTWLAALKFAFWFERF